MRGFCFAPVAEYRFVVSGMGAKEAQGGGALQVASRKLLLISSS